MTPITAKTLGQRLNALLKQSGMTQSQFGRRIGMAPGNLHHYLNGRKMPTLPVLQRLAEGLGVGLGELVKSDWPEPVLPLTGGPSIGIVFQPEPSAEHLASLSPRERKIISMRRRASLRIVAAKLDLSKERVRQIEQRAIEKLIALIPGMKVLQKAPPGRPVTRPAE